jgi:hypothetical protein
MATSASIIIVGCDDDKRLVELSRESLNRQAEQNQEMARQSQTVAEATKQLIQAESDVQKDATHLQQQLHAERAGLDQQYEQLETERRTMAAQRHRDPIIAQAIAGAVGLLVAALPLVLCWYLVKSLSLSVSDDAAAAEILIEQLAAQSPLLGGVSAMALSSISDNDPKVLLPPVCRPRLPQPCESTPVRESWELQAVVVVEGVHDIEFLKWISRLLGARDPSLSDLCQLESAGRIAFVVNNGGSTSFPNGLNSNGPREFHLLDREAGPTAVQREARLRALQARPNCRAFLTTKRAIENYLHPDAIREARDLEVSFGDFEDVGEIVARTGFEQTNAADWEALSRRARRRLRDKAKRWLNREAVDRMTSQRLAERDPDGEVLGWLRTIAQLAEVAQSGAA